MAFTLGALRTAVAPEALAGEFAEDRKRRMKREDLQRTLGIIGGIGGVVGIGRGISGIATDVSRRRMMGARSGLIEGMTEDSAFNRMIRGAALPAALGEIAGPRPPAPQPEAPAGFGAQPGEPAFGATVPRDPESLEDLIARATTKGAGQPGLPGQLGAGIAAGALGLPTGQVPRPGTEAFGGAGLKPEELEARARETRAPLARIAEAPPTEDLSERKPWEGVLGVPGGKLLMESLMEMAPDPEAVEAGAAPGIEESKGVRDWGRALENSLRQTASEAQRNDLLAQAEEAVTIQYAGNTELRDWMIRIIESLRGGGRAFGAGRMR